MTKFFVHGESWDNGDKKVFVYDNEYSTITYNGEKIDVSEFEELYKTDRQYNKARQFSADMPIGKTKDVSVLKIQLGLKCNYTCDYCNQAAHIEGSIDFTPKDIEKFMETVKSLNMQGVTRIEFWGGEPFVYWKTMKELTKKIRKINKTAQFSVITNGSILSDEIIDFLDKYDFSVSISHDGKNQAVRGLDPLTDPVKKNLILKLFARLHQKRRISFNSVLNSKNRSRTELVDFFKNVTGAKDVVVGEGTFIDAYTDSSLELMLYDYQDLMNYRKATFSEMKKLSRESVPMFDMKIGGFISSIVNGIPWNTITQKCGMDSPETLAIDMEGNVLSCQNVSANMKSFNGKSHNLGNVKDIDSVKLNTGTHWSFRDSCSKCPVLHLCRGSCFMLEGKYWDASCDNAYNDNVVFFMYAFEILTGYIPYWIDGPMDMPEWRKDVLGMEYPDLTRTRHKIIPIKEI